MNEIVKGNMRDQTWYKTMGGYWKNINQCKSTGTPWGHVVWKFETIWTKNTGVKKKKNARRLRTKR